MSIANAQLTVYWLTASKSDLSAKIMSISNERLMLSSLQTSKLQRISNIQTSQITALKAQAEAALESGDTDAYTEFMEQIADIQTDSADSDVTIQIISEKDNELDIKQKALETKLSAVTQNLESQEKLLETNVKEDFGVFNS